MKAGLGPIISIWPQYSLQGLEELIISSTHTNACHRADPGGYAFAPDVYSDLATVNELCCWCYVRAALPQAAGVKQTFRSCLATMCFLVVRAINRVQVTPVDGIADIVRSSGGHKVHKSRVLVRVCAAGRPGPIKPGAAHPPSLTRRRRGFLRLGVLRPPGEPPPACEATESHRIPFTFISLDVPPQQSECCFALCRQRNRLSPMNGPLSGRRSKRAFRARISWISFGRWRRNLP